MRHAQRIDRLERAAGNPDAPLTHMTLTVPLDRYNEAPEISEVSAHDVQKATVGRYQFDPEAREFTAEAIAAEPWKTFSGSVVVMPGRMSVSDWNQRTEADS